MKADRQNKNFEFISAKRKCLEDEFRRVFEREDFNIDRLTSHAEQAKYLQEKFENKEKLIAELQDKISTLRCMPWFIVEDNDKMEREYSSFLKEHEALKFRSEKLQRRVLELEQDEAINRKLEFENLQLKMELKKFQDNLKEMVDKYEGEWQRTKQAEMTTQALRNEQLNQTVKRLELQGDKAKERFEALQREHASEQKVREQTECVLRREIAILNERNQTHSTTISTIHRYEDKLKKTLEEEQQSFGNHNTEKRILQQQCNDLRARLESVERFTEKIESELKRQLQIKEEDLLSLKNDHHKALAEISDLLIELQRTRRMEKQLAEQLRLTELRPMDRQLSPHTRVKSRERVVRVQSPEYGPTHPWNAEDLRPGSPQYAFHNSAYYPPSNTKRPSPKASGLRADSDEGRRFYDIVKRSKANELPESEARVVNRILEKARYIT